MGLFKKIKRRVKKVAKRGTRPFRRAAKKAYRKARGVSPFGKIRKALRPKRKTQKGRRR